jgi:hypothetical protein
MKQRDGAVTAMNQVQRFIIQEKDCQQTTPRGFQNPTYLTQVMPNREWQKVRKHRLQEHEVEGTVWVWELERFRRQLPFGIVVLVEKINVSKFEIGKL